MVMTRSAYKKEDKNTLSKNSPYLTKHAASSKPETKSATKSEPQQMTSTKPESVTESVDIISVVMAKPKPYSGISDEDDERVAVAILVATFAILIGFFLYKIASLYATNGEKALYSPQIYFISFGLFITIRALRSIKDIM